MSGYPWQKLPDRLTLEREYIAGATYGELAVKYGCHHKTVYNTMRDRARRAGTRWPLKRDRQNSAVLLKAATVRRFDSVPTTMVSAELKWMRTQPWAISLREVARRAGLSQGNVSDAHTARVPRMSRQGVEKIMAVLEDNEKAYRISQNAQHGLDARRALIAARRTA